MTPSITSKPPLFSKEQLALLDPSKVPKHIAIIPDGNRRWAKRQAFSLLMGHSAGANTLTDIVRGCQELGIKTLTVYLFSTENWQRPQEEVKAFLWLLETTLQKELPHMLEESVRFHTIGNLARLPAKTAAIVESIKEATSKGSRFDFVAAINYGGRDEIIRVFQKMLSDYRENKFQAEQVSEELISQYLDTVTWGDPELLIRTSGEKRLSNFLLWQTSYAELYMTDVLWPDFKPQHLLEAVLQFQTRVRRKGE